MKYFLLGLGLVVGVSFLDVRLAFNRANAYDLPAAEAALKQKDYSKVISLLSPSVETLDRNGLFVLAKAYSASKNPEAAIKVYTACLTKDPKDVEAKTLIGAEQFVSGKDKEAMATLKEAIDINPRFVPAYKILIRIYEKKKNKYELRLLYQDLVEKVGDRSEYIVKLCELTTLDGLYDLALKYCQTGIQKDSSEASNFVFLGMTYNQTGETKKAENYLKKAADEFQGSELAQMTYAQFLDEKKNYIASYGFYKRAVDANKKSVPALQGLGHAALEIQKYQESLDAYAKACQMDKKTLPQFRRAANTLRTMRNADWLKKFEVAIDKCG